MEDINAEVNEVGIDDVSLEVGAQGEDAILENEGDKEENSTSDSQAKYRPSSRRIINGIGSDRAGLGDEIRGRSKI